MSDLLIPFFWAVSRTVVVAAKISIPSDVRKVFETALRIFEPRSDLSLSNAKFAFEGKRMGRKVKRKMRAMTTFRSEESVRQICQGLSVIHSASAKGGNIFNKLVEIFNRPTTPRAPRVAAPPEPVLDSGTSEALTSCRTDNPGRHRKFPNFMLET